jgi:hypothetical protein
MSTAISVFGAILVAAGRYLDRPFAPLSTPKYHGKPLQTGRFYDF